MSNVVGNSANPQVPAVSGIHSAGGRAVVASSAEGIAVEAAATKDTAVFAHSDTGMGVDARSKTGIGIRAVGGQYAGWFEGIVMVTGDIQLQNADCAEDFDVSSSGKIEPGTVMVIDLEGAIRPNTEAYDRRVAGVVSGAGDFKPGLVLGKQSGKPDRLPIALIGKVYCKVDATFGSIEIGDLLTTSSTPGHAMKVSEQSQAFGAVIGKALRPLTSGRGLIPILVALQ